MVFTSPRFVLFLVLILGLLHFLRGKQWQKIILTIGSCLFYAAWDWRYLGLLLLISGIDFIAGARIADSSDRRVRLRWLLVSIISNLGVLSYFKYCNFFIDNLRWILGVDHHALPSLDILLPAGISFYTFKTMSYTIDVYRSEMPPCRSWLDYFMFVTFFPELIAGPIVRGSVFLPQMLDREFRPNWERLRAGGSIFVQGLLKKLLIADRLALVVDPVFKDPAMYTTGSLWCALLGYTMQIYCDFSGYSDMAIGTARMMGFEMPENFRMPYLATGVTDFWRRWHITLSSWLRDYLYIPLGGNRCTPRRTMVNLMITMLLGGLWHGASWAFVVWGGLHGGALAVQRGWGAVAANRFRLPTIISWAITLFFVVMTWVPFRAETTADMITFFKGLYGLGQPGVASWIPEAFWWCLAAMVAGHVVGVLVESGDAAAWRRFLQGAGLAAVRSRVSGLYLEWARARVLGLYLFGAALLIVYLFAPMNTNPFIYFQF